MGDVTRAEILESIEVAVVELKRLALPHEIAQLRELAVDAADAQTIEQLEQIAKQVESLQTFCLSRAKSSAANRFDLESLGPRGWRRSRA
jgi:hypothetical protein